MKKLIAVTLSLVMLCVGVAALADITTPSMTNEDLIGATSSVANLGPNGEGADFFFLPVTQKLVEAIPQYKSLLDRGDEELKKLAEVGKVSYFGEDASKAIADILGDEDVSIDEFFAVIAGNYDESFGEVTVNLEVPSPYEADEKVAVLINNGTEWKVVEGKGNADGKGLSFVLEPELVLAVQANNGLLALASK